MIVSQNGLQRKKLSELHVGISNDMVNSDFARNIFPCIPMENDTASYDTERHKEYVRKRSKYQNAIDFLSFTIHKKRNRPCFAKQSFNIVKKKSCLFIKP